MHMLYLNEHVHVHLLYIHVHVYTCMQWEYHRETECFMYCTYKYGNAIQMYMCMYIAYFFLLFI